MIEDLKWIKSYYGETMMKFCRSHFHSLLDHKMLLPSILNDNFHKNKELINDILIQARNEDFIKFIYSKVKNKVTNLTKTTKTPYELFEEAGYTLYKCETQEQINKFKKFYTKEEKICTFSDNRLKRCDVFFAIKKDLNKIKRSLNPDREDEYGTSVISIQFNKGNTNGVSIKNRYNHTVCNPDATFNNNLENIAKGLTYSFENNYGYDINNSGIQSSLILNNYVLGPDTKYYKYNLEINAVYYCPDNIVIKDKQITKYEQEKYILMENHLIDLGERTITDLSGKDLTFEKHLGHIEKIEVKKYQKHKVIIIYEKEYTNPNKLCINKNNELIKISFPNVTTVSNFFLAKNVKLEKIAIPKVKTIGQCFLRNNTCLEEIDFPLIEKIENNFLSRNVILKKMDLPNLEAVECNFLYDNLNLKRLKPNQLRKK